MEYVTHVAQFQQMDTMQLRGLALYHVIQAIHIILIQTLVQIRTILEVVVSVNIGQEICVLVVQPNLHMGTTLLLEHVIGNVIVDTTNQGIPV